MKKILSVLFSVIFLLGIAGCSPDDFSAPGTPGQSSSLSSTLFEPADSSALESSQLPTSHQVKSAPEPTPRPEAVAGDGGDLDLLESSPYYSGQEALLQEICHVSTRKPPESFLWLNEDAVRETWGIEGHISAGCQDFVAYFDFDRMGAEEPREYFYAFIALFPGVDTPVPERSGNQEYMVIDDWTAAEGHPGFETRKVAAVYALHSNKGSLLSAEERPIPGASDPLGSVSVQVWVRWEAEGFQLMLQLPESAVDAFWENADRLFVKVDAENVERPFYMSPDEDLPVASAAEE